MKNRILLIAAFLVFVAAGASAQSKIKVGHIDFAKLYAEMPGQDSIKKVFQEHARSLQETFNSMQTEYQNKLQDYQSNMATMSNLIRQNKERELMDIQTRLENFRNQAEEDLQAKELELSKPIIDKARAAIRDIAKENGYTFILNNTESMILYAEPTDDITPLVKKKLGIK